MTARPNAVSIADRNTIDLVATRPDSSVVKLVITDHLAWDDLDSHCRMLQDKINTYLECIESGQFQRTKKPTIPPDPVIRICLALQHAPTPDARAFLARVEAFLAGAGIGFELDVRRAL